VRGNGVTEKEDGGGGGEWEGEGEGGGEEELQGGEDRHRKLGTAFCVVWSRLGWYFLELDELIGEESYECPGER